MSCSRPHRTATRPGLKPGIPWSVVAKLTPAPARPFDGTIGFSQAKLLKRSFVVTRVLAHGFNYFLLSFLHILLLFLVQSFGYIDKRYYMI